MANQTKNMLRSDFKNSYKKEILLILLSALFIFILISILSYNAQDNTLFHFSNQSKKISNLAGIAGANLAVFLFYLLGSAAYIFLFCLAITLYLMFTSKTLKEIRLRFFLLTLFFVATTTLLNILNLETLLPLSGGICGKLFTNILYAITGIKGSIVVVLTAIWTSTVCFLQLPLFPYLSSGLSKARNLTTSYLKAILKFKISSIKPSRLWQLKKSNLANTVTPASDLSKNIANDIEYWKNILEKPKTKEFETSSIKIEESNKKDKYVLPETKIFAIRQQIENFEEIKKESAECGKKLEEKLLCFGIKGKIVSIKPGPVITMYEYKPEIDSKISKITAMEDDLAMALTAKSIRILAPIPGKNAVGFEISNKSRQDVYFSDAIPSTGFKSDTLNLPLILGVDVTGKPIIDDLTKMPHLLVGGATGSGKSVGLHSMIISLLCHLNPAQLKLVLIDPKRLEFGAYNDIPHLLFPVVTSPDTAISSLRWVVQEMENRYLKIASSGARNINEYLEIAKTNFEFSPMPFIIVIIDELADLMMVGGKDLELQIVRIAQMARAAGIHMIVATQRPSVEVITGLIKVNFPSRISFRVSSKIDSRTILDSSGAEKLLGRGDMLFMNSSSPELQRAHGAYVSDNEIKNVVDWWKNQECVNYLNLHEALQVTQQEQRLENEDEIYGQVLEFIKNNDEVSISLLQRYFRIGFNRSARLIEKLEMDGLISPAQSGSKTRKVLR